MSHTPGPWRALPKLGCRNAQWHIINEHDELIAGIHATYYTAHLIAAAPELLAALQQMLIYEAKCDDDADDLIICRANARAAIAKATGDTHV